jgi:signal transduction histidine kinase
MVARDGRIVWVRERSAAVVDDHGVARFWQGVIEDITEQREAREAMNVAFEQEREASRRLRALDEMKNTFLAAVSHELRTPLAAILGLALTLEREELELDPVESRELLRRLASNARKLNRLLSDLLDLDRLGRGILEPRRRPTDVAELVRQVIENSDAIDADRLRLDLEPVVAELDAAKVERIVENLVANAIRHTPAGAAIWIRTRSADGGVMVAVDDDGPGIPDDLRAAVFEPFRQVPGRNVHAPGVGIGLSLVARFAELHGGRAWVEPREGGGSSFRVLIPGAGPEESSPESLAS